MQRPNFFILGAPKCGTTSLSDWLAEHPLLYMSPTKEPHFFNTDDNVPGRLSLSEYEALFEGATSNHLAVGESSVWYLWSREAVPNILEYCPDAKFIVCIRDPVQMAYALHHQQRFAGNEPIKDFKAAWDAQPCRARDLRKPAATSTQLLYGPTCKLGSQLERLLTSVERDRVHLVFLEDMSASPESVYEAGLRFLGLPAHQSQFLKSNEAKARRFASIRRLARRAAQAKRALKISRSIGILPRIDRWNRVAVKWQADPSMTAELRQYFRSEVALLARISGRDLSHWQ